MKRPSPQSPGAVWVLTGPTASGKSQLGLALAEQTGAEIVVADSVQAVKGFDIGSAKPSVAERARIPHHLVDVAPWHTPLDACRWAELARAAIDDIHRRNKPALLVGGTGLYLKALREGLIDVPSDPKLRQMWLAREKEQPGALFAALLARDPVSARKLSPNNPAHLMRALEISCLTGEPASQVRSRQGASAPYRNQWCELALVVEDQVLRTRIVQRVEHMLAAGWIDEVRHLLQRGVESACQSMRAIGYREIAAALGPTGTGACSSGEVKASIVQATWQYVRRQRTWLRREARGRTIHLVPAGSSPLHAMCQAALEHLMAATERREPA